MSTERPVEELQELPAGRVARGVVRVPPSKSLTNRWLNLALLARDETVIERPLVADDTVRLLHAVERLGFVVEVATGPARWRLTPPRSGAGAEPSAPEIAIDCGASGTMMRFLTASLCTLPGRFVLDGVPRLRQRPLGPLVEALRALGAGIEYLDRSGFPPLRIAGGGLDGGAVRVAAGESSQYVSALLMAGARARRPIRIAVDALVSRPYVEVTLAALSRAGVLVHRHGRDEYEVEPGPVRIGRVVVEGDASSAAYPAAAAAITGGDVILEGLTADSAQGDLRLLEVLADMGARVDRGPPYRVAGDPAALRAVEVDLGDMPDQVPTVAAVAVFCRGTTRLRGVAHLRLKESDRLAALAALFDCAGARALVRPDGLEIEGMWFGRRPPSDRVDFDPHDDHRIAMAAALIGLRRPGLRIRHPRVVEKSYPDFWQDLGSLLD